MNEDQDGLGNLVTAVRVGHKDEDLAPTATIVVLPNIEDPRFQTSVTSAQCLFPYPG